MKEYNPFNPNSIVTPTLFAGRTEYTLRIIKKLVQVKKGMPSSFFLYGERGIGKTALAKLIKSVAEIKDPILGNLNFLTAYYSVEKNQFISSVMQASLNELTDMMPKNIIEQLGTRLGNIFKNGKFSIGAFSVGVELGGGEQERETTVLKDLIVSILSNVVQEMKKAETDVKDGILIIIDEMDNIADIGMCAQLLRGAITTLDVKGLGNVSFLLIGYDVTVENFCSGDQSVRRQFDFIPLGVMPWDEAREVLTKGFTEAKVTWDEGALLENILVTGGYPHSIQMIGHHLIEVDTDMFIDDKDWDEAINKTAYDLQAKDFATLYDFKGKPSINELILDILAVRGKPLTKNEIYKLSEGKNIYQYIPALIKRGSIKEIQTKGQIILHSSLFRTSILFHILPKIKHSGYLSHLVKETQQADESSSSSSSASSR